MNKVAIKISQGSVTIVQSVITYALPSFAGQGDKSRINALFRKALKRGLCHTSLDIDELIITAEC